MTPEDVLERLRAWLAPKEKTEEKPEPSRASIDQLREAMKEMRGLLQRFGAAIGTAATAILTGIGFTQLHEIFPLPANSSQFWLTVLAIAAAVAALIGAAWLAARFFAAQRRILLTTVQQPGGLRGWFTERRRGFGRRERDIRNYFFDQTAAENSAASLRALELRAQRFERIAQRLPKAKKDKADELKAEAERLSGVVRLGMVHAAAGVLERRSHQAFKGSLTAAALVLTILGLLFLFGLADWSQGQRDLVALRKECAAATKAGATAACEHVVPKAKLDAAKAAKEAAEKKTKDEEAAALRAARRTLRGTTAVRAVARAAACRVVVAAEKGLAGNDAKQARQVALNRCVRAAG